MSTKLERITELAKEDRGRQFTSIAHNLTPKALLEAFRSLKKKAAAGVDEVTHEEYRKNEIENIERLHESLRSERYRAQPLKRIFIPKENGKQRPISIPALEDKIIQKATVTLLNAIYEVDFLDCSYGFRPNRNPQQALDEIGKIICRKGTQWVLEVDIQGYFDNIVRKQLMETMERRVKDAGILRLIGKWISVGAIEDGRLLTSQTGTGQGQIISPLLANIYLHYVLDEWFENVVKPRLKGTAYLVRYVDDFIICFEYKEDAMRVQAVLGKRLGKFGLTLHPQKTKLLKFGKEAMQDSEKPGGKPPETFDFLGFTHIAKRSRRGYFTFHVGTMKKRLSSSIKRVTHWCIEHRHRPLKEQQAGLNQRLRGHYQYYGRPTNFEGIRKFYKAVVRAWHKHLNRRTRGRKVTWEKFNHILELFPLEQPRIKHAWAER